MRKTIRKRGRVMEERDVTEDNDHENRSKKKKENNKRRLRTSNITYVMRFFVFLVLMFVAMFFVHHLWAVQQQGLERVGIYFLSLLVSGIGSWILVSGLVIIPSPYGAVSLILGTIRRNHGPGLNYFLPLIESVESGYDTKVGVIDIPNIQATTLDQYVQLVNLRLRYSYSKNPIKAVLDIEDLEKFLKQVVESAFKEAISLHTWEQSTKPDFINKIKEQVSSRLNSWGIRLWDLNIADQVFAIPTQGETYLTAQRAAMLAKARGINAAAVAEQQQVLVSMAQILHPDNRDKQAELVLDFMRTLAIESLGSGSVMPTVPLEKYLTSDTESEE